MSMPVIQASQTSRSQAITDLIQSIALEEAAISHILNAEGEKLQRVIYLEDITPEELIEVNKSVECMVKAITQLETVLKSKLDIFACNEDLLQ